MTDLPTSIAVSSIINDIAPYALALIPVLIGWGIAELRKLSGIQISADAVTKIDTLAKAEAGALVAASETNLAGVAIPVGSPMVVNAANRVIAAAPGVLANSGLSPDAVAAIVAGHLGAIQAAPPTSVGMSK